MEAVVENRLQGLNPTEIAKKMNIPRGRVLSHLENWNQFVEHDLDIKKRAKQVLATADQHYDKLMKEAWDAIENAKVGTVKDHVAAIGLAHTIEKTRVGLYQQAGINADDSLAAEMLETQRKQELLIDALKKLCPNCRKAVAQELSEVTNKTTELVTVVEVRDER